MSTTNTNVTIYNGTFRKANGESRTMNFIRGKDLPLTLNGKSVVQDKKFKNLEVLSLSMIPISESSDDSTGKPLKVM
jgi:hypothetical protein